MEDGLSHLLCICDETLLVVGDKWQSVQMPVSDSSSGHFQFMQIAQKPTKYKEVVLPRQRFLQAG